jgi:triacylglycerol esterase/lipase EstA (alpha/beta hydrolase family)
MQLLFVHGWSVTNTSTYGELPEALSAGASDHNLDLNIQHIYLGKYISFHDEVTMDDIGKAMDRALRDLPENNDNIIKPFSCITHSTGGPVVRYWIDKYYGSKKIDQLPLKHLVMLAPANHGSALAKLGKARLGRIKAWFNGVEPGQKVLDWLSLGSDGQWKLNESYLNYNNSENGFFPFVLTGQGIDNKFYDFLNTYLVEKGSDGVVRVAGANMNCRYFSLVQSRDKKIRKQPSTTELIPEYKQKKPENIALGVYKNHSHSGKDKGIMQSIESDDTNAPVVQDILKCLKVEDTIDYDSRSNELEQLTSKSQKGDSRYCMLVINVCDETGVQIGMDDYDIILLAGNQYQPQKLPQGFLKDSQMNNTTGRFIYYLDADKMHKIKDGKFGIRVIARPQKGFAYYQEAEYRSNGVSVNSILVPNQTTYVNITLNRFVDKNVFRFGPVKDKPLSFKKTKPFNEKK